MPNYVPNALHEFQHPYTKRPQHAPHKWERPNYEAKKQWSKEEGSLEILPEQRRKKSIKWWGVSIFWPGN